MDRLEDRPGMIVLGWIIGLIVLMYLLGVNVFGKWEIVWEGRRTQPSFEGPAMEIEPPLPSVVYDEPPRR